MVHSDRGSTVTMCEDCLSRLKVTVEDGEVVDVNLRE